MPEEPSSNKRAVVLVSIGGIAALFVLIALALRSANEVGGFCAEGGPYVIRQGCPVGVLPVMAIGIPLLFACGIAYFVALPQTWKSLIYLAWPVLFVGLGLVFIYSAFTASDSFGVGAFVIGLMMAGIGAIPFLLPKAALRGFGYFPEREDGLAPQVWAILVGAVIGALVWFGVLG
ncbi:MAG: hypothetical protein ACKORM_00905 [Solirubrobacterales bacterium]